MFYQKKTLFMEVYEIFIWLFEVKQEIFQIDAEKWEQLKMW